MDPNASPENLEDDPGVSTASDRLGDDPSENVEPWAPLIDHLGDTIDSVACYFGVQIERGKLSLKEYVWKIAIGLGAFFVGVVTLMVAITFVLYGLSQGLSDVAGLQPWLGFLTVGLSFLILVAVIITWQIKRSNQRNLRKRIKDYERTTTPF